jgi:putative ABC transport system substrate-binding protein
MRRRDFITLVGGTAAWPLAARAQQPKQVLRVGVLLPNTESDPVGQARATALERGLEERGWTPDRNLRIDYRWGANSVERLKDVTAELLALAPDVILASTSRAIATLQNATRTVPIVMTSTYEPVAQGFVQSLAHPGGNITGFTQVEATIGAKWLELLKEISPHVRRVGFMFDPDNPGPMQTYATAQVAASKHAVELFRVPVHGPAEIEAAMATLDREGNAGLIAPRTAF